MMSVTSTLPFAGPLRVVVARSVPSLERTSILTATGAPETSVNPAFVWNCPSLTSPFAVAASPGPMASALANPGTNCPKVPLSPCVYARLVVRKLVSAPRIVSAPIESA